MKYIFKILTFVLFSFECSALEWGEVNHQAVNISIFELISNGEKYDGWNVRVDGIGVIEFESHLLFISRERYDRFDTSSSILLDIYPEDIDSSYSDLEKYKGEWFLVEGIYNYLEREKLESNEFSFGPNYSGSISNINRISVDE